MNTFDNDTELLERLESCRERLHRAEDCAADLAAKLQAQKIEVLDLLESVVGEASGRTLSNDRVDEIRMVIARYKQGK